MPQAESEQRGPPARFLTEQAWDRYRVWCQQQGRDNGQFFSDVGIQR
jgi:hypothetical protein